MLNNLTQKQASELGSYWLTCSDYWRKIGNRALTEACFENACSYFDLILITIEGDNLLPEDYLI